jgi:hypothetical protein
MRTNLGRGPGLATRRGEQNLSDEERESALLAEFMRHDSVPSLAGAIAERLGGGAHEDDLIARAGLNPDPSPKRERGVARTPLPSDESGCHSDISLE